MHHACMAVKPERRRAASDAHSRTVFCCVRPHTAVDMGTRLFRRARSPRNRTGHRIHQPDKAFRAPSTRTAPAADRLPSSCRMRTSIRHAAICSITVLSLAPRAAAQAERPRPDKTLSPFFFVEGGDPAVDRLPLKDTHVEVAISGVIADVTVRQVYENHGQRPLHARYVFPASPRAAVSGMTMTTGNTRIVATIKEREKAKQAFQTAKREGKSASLLEESRPNVFTMNVANILPGDAISVELRYTELLVPVDGVYEFVYPTVVGPRYSSKSEAEASDEDAFVKT